MNRRTRRVRGWALGVVLLAANAGSAGAGAQEPSPLPPVPLGLELYMPVPEDSPITREGIELGRRLFFEPRLSVDGTISCASCHRPEHGFADTVPLSEGVGGRRPARHTPGLLNAGYRRSFFWDGRTDRLEEQVIQPIVRPDEMGLELKTAVARLREDGEYRAAFAAAFPEGLSPGTLARALASYVRSLRSGNSRVDRYLAGDPSALGPDEREGYRIFLGRGGCASCHGGPLFGDGRFHNTGVAWPPDRSAAGRAPEDPGRFAVTRDSADLGAFSTPSLRDVARTPPYMHDGSLATLRDVMEFYDRGARPNPYLDPEIRPLGLSDREKEQLASFLRALNGRPDGTSLPVPRPPGRHRR